MPVLIKILFIIYAVSSCASQTRICRESGVPQVPRSSAGSDSEGPGWRLEICISNKHLADADT